MTVTTYDFKKVTVVVDGFIVTGYMDGDSIAVEPNEDEVATHVGADGGVTFSESNDKTATLTLTLKQTSPSLPYLRDLRKSKKLFPVQIIDKNTNEFRAGGTQCRIVRAPGRNYGNEVTGVEVPIVIADYDEA